MAINITLKPKFLPIPLVPQNQLHYTPSTAILPTCCYQLDSNLANLEDTV